MNLTEQPHSRPDSKCEAAGAPDRVFIIKRGAPLVIRRFQRRIEIDAGLAVQGVFNPIVIEKRLEVNPLPLIQRPAEDIGKKLHSVVSIEFDTIARQMSVQEKAVVTMVLRSLIKIERLIHRVIEGNVICLIAAQLEVYPRTYDRQKISHARERKSRSGFVRTIENVVVIFLGQREVRFNTDRTDAVSQNVARIDRPRSRARRGKPCCNCQKTVTTF